MSGNSLFDNTMSVVAKALDLHAFRHKLLISDIVNMDTPNYRGFDIEMKKALGRLDGNGDTLPLDRTHADDLSAGSGDDGTDTPPVVEATDLTQRADNNGVDLDRTMAGLAENTLMFNALSQMINQRFKQLKDAINGGKA